MQSWARDPAFGGDDEFTDSEPAVGFPASYSDFHDFAYAYTVG